MDSREDAVGAFEELEMLWRGDWRGSYLLLYIDLEAEMTWSCL